MRPRTPSWNGWSGRIPGASFSRGDPFCFGTSWVALNWALNWFLFDVQGRQGSQKTLEDERRRLIEIGCWGILEYQNHVNHVPFK